MRIWGKFIKIRRLGIIAFIFLAGVTKWIPTCVVISGVIAVSSGETVSFGIFSFVKSWSGFKPDKGFSSLNNSVFSTSLSTLGKSGSIIEFSAFSANVEGSTLLSSTSFTPSPLLILYLIGTIGTAFSWLSTGLLLTDVPSEFNSCVRLPSCPTAAKGVADVVANWATDVTVCSNPSATSSRLYARWLFANSRIYSYSFSASTCLIVLSKASSWFLSINFSSFREKTAPAGKA